MPTRPRRKAVNVSIDGTLLREARAHHINLSQVLEQRLAELVRQTGQLRWLEKNRGAIEDYNRRIEQSGAFSDGLRRY